MDMIENKSPKFRNTKCYKHKQSPVELKDKMRKNYKNRILNCRSMLMNRIRGLNETDLRNALTEIYTNMSCSPDNQFVMDEEEHDLQEEIKHELIEEELEWWTKEYENSNMDNVDWSSLEDEDNVICPICQKTNIILKNSKLVCSLCKYEITTQNILSKIKHIIVSIVNKHNSLCDANAQFHILSESCDTHMYLICDKCIEMYLVI